MAQTVYDLTSSSLSKELGVEIPDIYVVIAKHSVLGLDTEAIQQILGCSRQDIAEVEADGLYGTVRDRVAGTYANQSATQTTGWDAIEDMAIQGLVKRLPYEKDSEFLLKVAAVANRAVRKHSQSPAVLDPSVRAGRTTISLSQRLVSKLSSNGDLEQTEIREVSIKDGSLANPSFNEIDGLLSVRNLPVMTRAVEIQAKNREPSADEMFQQLVDKGGL